MNISSWITLMTLLPLIGAVVTALLGRGPNGRAKQLAAGFSLAASLMGVWLWAGFDSSRLDLQFVERHTWVPSLGVDYHVGVDGLGVVMVLLTSIVLPFAIVAARGIQKGQAAYFALLLCMQGALYGAFTSLNFFHWFIYWELSLIPAYFLVRLWGGDNRKDAANVFFVYTMVGSIGLLLAMLSAFLVTGTFDFQKLSIAGHNGELAKGLAAKLGWVSIFAGGQGLAVFICCLALLGFAIKVPLFPFHTWLPEAYCQAPTSTTMVLTGVMSKLGLFGMLRILLPIFEDQMRAIATPLLWLSVATIVLSSLAALNKRDLKSILAYSSINHLGYCLMGIFAMGQVPVDKVVGSPELRSYMTASSGVIFQMFSHGLIAALLFACVGFLESRPEGCPRLDNSGGLRKQTPVLAGLMGVALFASLGLPGLSGFVGEFLIFSGAFGPAAWAAALATLGLLLSALVHLNVIQKVFCGPLPDKWSKLADLNPSERISLAPALVLVLVLGVWPQILISVTRLYKGF